MYVPLAFGVLTLAMNSLLIILCKPNTSPIFYGMPIRCILEQLLRRKFYALLKLRIKYIRRRGTGIPSVTGHHHHRNAQSLQIPAAATTSSAVKFPTLAEFYRDTTFDYGGVVVGRLTFRIDGHTIDCRKVGIRGIMIPPNINRYVDMQSDALFILLVEKHGTYWQLAEDKFYDRFPCIIVRSVGVPDVSTHQFLRKMKVELKLPVMTLVDSDPFRLYILSFFGRGLPNIKWLGVRPSDLDKYKIPEYCRLPVTEKDIKYVKTLLTGDFVKKNPRWEKDLNLMMKSKQKSESEALSSLGFLYLTEVYLPLKLQEKDWL
ncbi:DNA topoisomerase 6 subunit A [Orobanche gracilis]